MICEYCGKRIKKSSNIIIHTNIAQRIKTHHFCSETCKTSWGFNIQKPESKMLTLWALGTFRENFYFIKKQVKTTNSKLIRLDINKSHFDPNLNRIELLKLVDIDGVKFLKVQ